MIDIVNVAFTIGVPPRGESELESRASTMFDAWDEYLAATLPLPDYALRFELAEGSLKGKGRVAATLMAVYIGVANFGGFVSGVREMATLSRRGGDFLLHEARELVHPDETATLRGRRTAGRIAQLERLFVRVQKHELTPEEAMQQVERLIAGEELPASFLEEIRAAIRDLPRQPKQLELSLNYTVVEPLPAKTEVPTPSEPTPRLPRSPVPPPARFRVEIWRESRSDRRQIRVAAL